MRILILGGYGVFGGRLVELLSDLSELEILVSGRNGNKAEKFCRSINSAAKLVPIELDRRDIIPALETMRPEILVDASGPFQEYQENPYVIVKACIANKVHYLDFADAADFVFGISLFNEEARLAGVSVLSGVSSFPVLTAAVLRELGKEMTVTSVVGGIAPSPHAGIGLNVMRAVVSYAGGPVKLTRDGKPYIAKGLTESMRYTIAAPGHLPLRNIHFSLVDVPDLQILPMENPTITDIWMGAGTMPEPLLHVLDIMAKFRALLHAPSFEMLSPLFYKILNRLKYGDHRGGMFVEATGDRNGVVVTQSWHLLAEGDDGPYIPSMAVEAVIRRWLSGVIPDTGARVATRELDLSDYETLFENRTIYMGVREGARAGNPIFQQILGPSFSELPPTLRLLHSPKQTCRWRGEAQVVASSNPIGGLIARMIGFPHRSGSTSVSVTIKPEGEGESWIRKFGNRVFNSALTPGEGRNSYLMRERFGPVTVSLAIVWKEEKLWFVPRRWSFLGLPLPKFLMPRGDSFEFEQDGKFHFDVTINLPVIGHVVSYRGWLTNAGTG